MDPFGDQNGRLPGQPPSVYSWNQPQRRPERLGLRGYIVAAIMILPLVWFLYAFQRRFQLYGPLGRLVVGLVAIPASIFWLWFAPQIFMWLMSAFTWALTALDWALRTMQGA